jgi:hypothetical protein
MGDSIIVCDGALKGRYIVNDISGSKLMHVDIYRNIGDKTACCYRSKIKIIKEWNKSELPTHAKGDGMVLRHSI